MATVYDRLRNLGKVPEEPDRYLAPWGYRMDWPIGQSVYFLGLLAISGMLLTITSLFAHCGYCAWRDRMSLKKGR